MGSCGSKAYQPMVLGTKVQNQGHVLCFIFSRLGLWGISSSPRGALGQREPGGARYTCIARCTQKKQSKFSKIRVKVISLCPVKTITQSDAPIRTQFIFAFPKYLVQNYYVI